MATESTKFSVRLSAGTRDTWGEDRHNFLSAVHGKWKPKDHNDMEAIAFLLRGNPLAVANKTAMSDTVFAKLNQDDITAAEHLAYDILNIMFKEGSPAKTLIRAKAANGTIPIGSGAELFQALSLEFTRGKTEVLDVSDLVNELATFKMVSNEGAGTYLMRFHHIVDELSLKDPPQKFPEAVLMQWISRGLPVAYEEVKKKQSRGEYKIDLGDLEIAIHAEESFITQQKGANAHVSDGLTRKQRKAQKLKETMKPEDPNATAAAAGKEGSSATTSNSKAKGKGKGKGKGKPPGPNHANRQCYRCWEWGHISSDCTSDAAAAVAPEGVDPRVWCPFHYAYGFHSVENCFRNPQSWGYQGSFKGKGFGRGGGKGKFEFNGYPSSYQTNYGKGKGGKGYGRGFVADTRRDADDTWSSGSTDNTYDTASWGELYNF